MATSHNSQAPGGHISGDGDRPEDHRSVKHSCWGPQLPDPTSLPLLARQTFLFALTVDLRLVTWSYGSYYDRPAVRLILELSANDAGDSISSLELEVRFDPLVHGAQPPPIVQHAPKKIMTNGHFSHAFIAGYSDTGEKNPYQCCGLCICTGPGWAESTSPCVFRLYAGGIEEAKGKPMTGYRIILTVLQEEGPISMTTRLKVKQHRSAFRLPRALPRSFSTKYRIDGLSAKEKLRPSANRFEEADDEELHRMVQFPGGLRRYDPWGYQVKLADL